MSVAESAGSVEPAGSAEPVGGVEPMLRARGAAHLVMQKCLSVQADAAPRGRLARFFGLSPLHPDAHPWFKGSIGELDVGAELGTLGPEWTVLHALPVGTGESDVDHVVIGPPGVFAINTKNHSGQRIWLRGEAFWVNGQKTPHIRNSKHEAVQVAKQLSSAVGFAVAVTPVIVVVRPREVARKAAPSVEVIVSGSVRRALTKRRPTLAGAERAAICKAAEQRSTWRAEPVDTHDTHPHAQQFGRLRAEVKWARLVQSGWVLLGVAALLVFLVSAGPGLAQALTAALTSAATPSP